MDSLFIKNASSGRSRSVSLAAVLRIFRRRWLEKFKYRPLDDARSIAFLMIRLSDRYGVGSFNKAEIQKYCTGGEREPTPVQFFVWDLGLFCEGFLVLKFKLLR